MNAASIADAVGMSRETVRRKLKVLVVRGVLMEKTRGRYIAQPGSSSSPKPWRLPVGQMASLASLCDS